MRFTAMLCLVSGLFLLTGFGNKINAAELQKAGQLKATIVGCKYLIYLPDGYGEKDKKWPVVLYLHSSGERGDNLELVKRNGWPQMIEQSKKLKFIIVAPQCPKAQGQWWSVKIETLIALLNYIESKYDVDKDRVYLTGISMGGYGTWTLGQCYPDRFAAIAPLCGGGDSQWAGEDLKSVPIWAFHGAKDDVVPVKCSKDMVDAVNAAGGNAKLTIYPDAGHSLWATYADPMLYEWLLSHRISDRKK